MAVLTLAGKPIDWSNPPKSTDLVKWSYSDEQGDIVKASFFVICALDHANTLAVKKFGSRIRVIQPPYNTDVPASAGTHDYDYMFDLWIPGVDGFVQQRFFRTIGWFIWFRQPWQGFTYHQHGGPLPPNGRTFPTRVGIYVPGQLDDYWREAYGLKDLHYQSADPSWFPTDAAKQASIFDLDAYIKEQEDLMASDYSDWSPEAKVQFWDDFERRFLDKATVTLKKNPGTKDDVEIPIRNAIERILNG